MKLEHLSPYLLHKLMWTNGEDLFEMTGITYMSVQLMIGKNNPRYAEPDEWHKAGFRPIFRPLDLTKEIEHEGNKFIPIERIQSSSENADWLIRNAKPEKTLVGASFPEGITLAMYCQVVRLFEYHFDVFGLIDEGLAIDVNKVESNVAL